MDRPSEEVEQRFLALREAATHCMIATASLEGAPEAAVMAFAAGPGLSLYLYTLNDSRKYGNLRHNPRAALTLLHDTEYAQLNGEVEELDGEAASTARRIMLTRSAGDREGYHGDQRCRYFLFHPTRVCLRVDQGYPAVYEVWNPQRHTPQKTLEL